MTSNVTATAYGSGIGNDASNSGIGLVKGVYTVAWAIGDPLIFTDFSRVDWADVSINGIRPSQVHVDAVTANRINIIPGSSVAAGRATAHVMGVK